MHLVTFISEFFEIRFTGRCNVNAGTHENITPLMLVCRLTNCNVKATQFAKYLLDNVSLLFKFGELF